MHRSRSSNTCCVNIISSLSSALALLLLLAAVVTDARSSSELQADGNLGRDQLFNSLHKRDASESLVDTGNDGSVKSTGTETDSDSSNKKNEPTTDTESELETPSNSEENKINCSLTVNVNDTRCLKGEEETGYIQSISNRIAENKGMLLRTLYVTLGVTGLVVIYFVVRAVRLRRRRTKSRKYGIITQSGDHGDMEMEPLGDGDDDDDDYTVFELNGRKK